MSQTLVDLFAIVSLAIFVVFLIYNLFRLALFAFSAHVVMLL